MTGPNFAPCREHSGHAHHIALTARQAGNGGKPVKATDVSDPALCSQSGHVALRHGLDDHRTAHPALQMPEFHHDGL